MAEGLWYYARHDQQFGPVSAADLKHLADACELSPDDLLWREGMESWSTAINLRGLFSPDVPPPNSATFAAGSRHQSPRATPDLLSPGTRGDLRRLRRITLLS